MIKRIRLIRFKRFDDEVFDLEGQSVILAGPNNSGKTTLLHAIAAWNLALQLWQLESGSKGGRTKRISVVLDEFTALPLREMNLLWLNRHTAKKSVGDAKPKAAPIYIQVDFHSALGEESLTIEFYYANQKLIYARPVESSDNPVTLQRLPSFAEQIKVVHIPSFSGISTQEPRHSEGIRDKMVGEGRAGEIVRNLILDIWERSLEDPAKHPWCDFVGSIKRLFGYELLPPISGPKQPHILCEYRSISLGEAGRRSPRLDIANAGSGFHQTLLLLAFFYAKPSSILLVDEPDAHLHFILQTEIFDLLRGVASARGCQLLVSTHAEALLAQSEPDGILSFVGKQPRRLLDQHQKRALTIALKSLSTLDLLQADHVGAILYVEDESDYKLLREWAEILQHGACRFLAFPFVYPLRGKGNIGKAKEHFVSLRHAKPDIKALCLLDRDSDAGPEARDLPQGFELYRWGRYEIENYLLQPGVIARFLEKDEDLFTLGTVVADKAVLETEFGRNFPAGIDYMSDVQSLSDIKGSEFIVKVLGSTSMRLPKRDLYLIAKKAMPGEIHPHVRDALDRLNAILPAVSPAMEAGSLIEDPEGVEELEGAPDSSSSSPES